jgi:hypothetical protein
MFSLLLGWRHLFMRYPVMNVFPCPAILSAHCWVMLVLSSINGVAAHDSHELRPRCSRPPCSRFEDPIGNSSCLDQV